MEESTEENQDRNQIISFPPSQVNFNGVSLSNINFKIN